LHAILEEIFAFVIYTWKCRA